MTLKSDQDADPPIHNTAFFTCLRSESGSIDPIDSGSNMKPFGTDPNTERNTEFEESLL